MWETVICKPPIKELCDHPSIIASPRIHVRTSNSTLHRVVRKTFPWENVHGRDHTTCCTCCNKCSNLALEVRMHRIYMFHTIEVLVQRGTPTCPHSKCIVAYLAIRVDAQIRNSLQTIYRAFMVCMKMPYRTEGTRVFSQKEQDDA